MSMHHEDQYFLVPADPSWESEAPSVTKEKRKRDCKYVDDNLSEMIDFCTKALGTHLQSLLSNSRITFITRLGILDTDSLSDRSKLMLLDAYKHIKAINKDFGQVIE